MNASGGMVWIASAAGSTGSIAVNGPGSFSAGQVNVGDWGVGSLLVSNGGKVYTSYAVLGNHTGSSGAATVTGAGSTWDCSTILWVGLDGQSSLTVADGGSVTTRNLYAAITDLQGNGTINAKGLVSDVDLLFDPTTGATRTISFGTGGVLNLTLVPQSIIGAGYRGTGSITMNGGVNVSGQGGELGFLAGSTGSALVSGVGTTWSMYGSLNMARGGTGSLTITDGPKVNSQWESTLGDLAGSNGSVVVSGTGSSWTVGDRDRRALTIGKGGIGSVTVSNGASLISRSCGLGTSSGSSGTLEVRGAGSSWTCNGTLDLGWRGSGSVTVADGATVTTGGCALGDGSGNGSITITGTGSTWNNSGRFQGGYVWGSGCTTSITVENGGTLNQTGTFCARANQLHGDGTISAEAGSSPNCHWRSPRQPGPIRPSHSAAEARCT